MEALRTGVSKAFFLQPSVFLGGVRKPEPFEAATFRLSEGSTRSKRREVCWLDELLIGGIALPKLITDETRAISILLTGPPGSGKSTLAMELGYRLALRDADRPDGYENGLNTLYITSEGKASWVKEKAVRCGWEKAEYIFSSVNERLSSVDDALNAEQRHLPAGLVNIWETLDFAWYLSTGEETKEIFPIIRTLANLFPSGDALREIGQELYRKMQDRNLQERISEIAKPDLLVVDSVNTLDISKRGEIFEKFMNIALLGPRLVVIVLDGELDSEHGEFWNYTADIIVRLGRKRTLDYTTRTIEIVKARYQQHVEGEHQLKITKTIDSVNLSETEARRAHPYRKEGGIFIYPSIHYYLSLYKRRMPQSTPGQFEPPIRFLGKILPKGFPKKRCTGFIGGRGSHKSHLGYLCLLSRLLEQGSDEGALSISLRDDEGMARQTLQNILIQQHHMYKAEAQNKLHSLEQSGQLEILYYPPGFITPEEFFHRMYMSIHRLKSWKHSDSNEGETHDQPVTVLFNSLDQLAARFPLCAEQRNFVPGIIETLNAEQITSFFIAVEEQGQPPEQYGLLSMADALISFNNVPLAKEAYAGHMGDARPEFSQTGLANIGDPHRTVTLRVDRFAGGQAAGSGGILELIDNDSAAAFPVYGEQGLHFTPFSPNYAMVPT